MAKTIFGLRDQYEDDLSIIKIRCPKLYEDIKEQNSDTYDPHNVNISVTENELKIYKNLSLNADFCSIYQDISDNDKYKYYFKYKVKVKKFSYLFI